MKQNTCILLPPRRAPCLATGTDDVKPAITLLFMCRNQRKGHVRLFCMDFGCLIAVFLMLHLIKVLKKTKRTKRKKGEKEREKNRC